MAKSIEMKYLGPRDVTVNAYTKTEAAEKMFEALKNEHRKWYYRVWVQSVKPGRFPIVSRIADGVKYGKKHVFLIRHEDNIFVSAKEVFWTINSYEYDYYSTDKLNSLCLAIGYTSGDVARYFAQQAKKEIADVIGSDLNHKMLHLIDRKPRSLNLYNRIASSKLGEIFGDAGGLYVMIGNDNSITIGNHGTGTKITIGKDQSLLRKCIIMQAEIEAYNEYKIIIDAQSEQIIKQSEQIIDLQNQLSVALHKAKIFEDSFIASEAANAELTNSVYSLRS